MQSESSGLTSSMISAHRSASLRSWHDKLGGMSGSIDSTAMAVAVAAGKQRQLPPTLSLSDLYFSAPKAPGPAASGMEREQSRLSESVAPKPPSFSSRSFSDSSGAAAALGSTNLMTRHESELPEGLE